MPRCADCAWFPWKPGADVSNLPTMNCYPGSPRRRWTPEGVTAEHDCGYFKPQVTVNPRQEAAAEVSSDASEEVEPAPQSEKPKKAPKRRR